MEIFWAIHFKLFVQKLMGDVYSVFRLSWHISVHPKINNMSDVMTTDNVMKEQKYENLILISLYIAYLVRWPRVAMLSLKQEKMQQKTDFD